MIAIALGVSITAGLAAAAAHYVAGHADTAMSHASASFIELELRTVGSSSAVLSGALINDGSTTFTVSSVVLLAGSCTAQGTDSCDAVVETAQVGSDRCRLGDGESQCTLNPGEMLVFGPSVYALATDQGSRHIVTAAMSLSGSGSMGISSQVVAR